MNKNYDFIIIGQGIAGSVLSWYLLERNLKFLVVNDPKKNSSSTAALGVYNPITGKKFVETWSKYYTYSNGYKYNDNMFCH